MMTMGARINVSFYQALYVSLFFVFVILFVSSLLPCALCVDGDDYSQTGNPALLPIVTNLVYSELSNLSKALKPDIEKKLDFCIIDLKADWDGAFDFTKQLDFLTECVKKTKGDLRQRLCTAAEIKFYFSSFSGTDANHVNYLKPNKNCNLSSWVSGCEPGWGCSVDGNQKVDLKTSQTIPLRTYDCQPCCEGFFCPMGLTCMIPCPLGSHCPPGKLNKTTGNCDPYSYQLPPGKPDHACGGADIWTDVVSSSDIFCAPGSYCPTTTRKVSCSSGHYCRKGSTSQQRCFPLTTCNPNSSNQNIHAYGVLLIAMLSLALLICYNCSDQVLTTRERRAAKKREAAARQARETAQARERWKAAKNIAKKGGIAGLQQSLSRTFSRTKSKRDQLKIFGQSKRGTDTSLLPTMPSGSTSGEESKNNEPGSLTKMIHDIENDPTSHQGFHMEIGDKNIKKQAPRGKKLHTQSQIFKYAYGQIEKEKAMQQNKNITFSGVISMATDNDMRTRPVIEVAFKDLTLTLKGKNKHLLRSVTGKLMPGRVSAVMGPSGAGKTTFLSALLGKASGCTITGMILVNGKDEPIQSYRRIIGFVPQDDIVHGDLTVEENLRFNARCRLPADMPKADKVLIVERVIESLGLQNVRDSLVGTVERRGISGGQRKRVNVGIEMVIEPSVLILDEPTSGLDSASSQLLLRALRREAIEGVNITMVVHQPSYALFKMFDDLILLAKGGLTVYHGSVKKVEEYFSGLGIIVPERVNPPDHFIDILEGIVKPSSVTREQLPVRWMLHNGYPVPPDMLKLLDDTGSPSNDLNPSQLGSSTEQTLAAWNAEQKRDSAQHIKDLSNRTTPGVTRQYRYFLGRVIKQRLREAKIQAVDFMLLLVAGACLGTLATVTDETFGSLGYTYTVIAVSLLCKISALRSFTVDRLEYQRESASGISSLAYFLSKDTIDHFNTVIKPLVYLSMFFFFNNPRSTFQDNYAVLLCLVYCVTGMAYILAIYLEPGPAQLCSVLIPVVLTLIASQDRESFMVKHLGDFIYPKWALEAFVVANARRYSGVWLITRCTSLMTSGYNLHDWTLCLIVLLCMGVICRVVAFCLLMRIKK